MLVEWWPRAGADPREGRRGDPQTAAGHKIETPGRSKVGFSSPRMHQNSPFGAQKSKKNSEGGGHPPHISPPRCLDPRARLNSRLDLGAYGASIRPQSHLLDAPLAARGFVRGGRGQTFVFPPTPLASSDHADYLHACGVRIQFAITRRDTPSDYYREQHISTACNNNQRTILIFSIIFIAVLRHFANPHDHLERIRIKDITGKKKQDLIEVLRCLRESQY